MSIESLEPRIAPASLTGSILAYTDVDGDAVRITFATKSLLRPQHFEFDTEFAADGPQKLELIDLSGSRRFDGTSIRMEVQQAADGNARADIASIDATGVDLREVKVVGDLAELHAGDFDKRPAVAVLDVYSLGVSGTETQGERETRSIRCAGAIETLRVTTDVNRIAVLAKGRNGHIGSVTLGGFLIGGDKDSSGSIVADRNIGTMLIGAGIIGGNGLDSGTVFAKGKLKSVTVIGSVIGGAGTFSGGVLSLGAMSSVRITGDLLGGDGTESGNVDSDTSLKQVTIEGSVRGGAGFDSGGIDANTTGGVIFVGGNLVSGTGDKSGLIEVDRDVQSITVNGAIIGGSSELSGIECGRNVGSIVVGQYVAGGSGDYSGLIFADGNILNLEIGESLVGGGGEQSGSVDVFGSIRHLSIGDSIMGGTGELSGVISAFNGVTSATIRKSIVGGAGDDSGHLDVGWNADLIDIGENVIGGSGSNAGSLIVFNQATEVRIGGSVNGGSGLTSGTVDLWDVASLMIAGNVQGGSGEASGAIFVGFGGLRSAVIGGDLIGGDGPQSGVVRAWLMENLTVSGSVVSGAGPFSGSIISDWDINSVTIGGDVLGSASNPVHVIAYRAPFRTAGEDFTIGTVEIGGDAQYIDILAGYSLETEESTTLVALERNVSIGEVRVAGDWTAGSIVAGVLDPVADGFGNADDVSVMAVERPGYSRIESIEIGGVVNGTATPLDHFGFTAELVGSVQIGAVAVSLTAGRSNDQFVPLAGATTGDVTINEVT